MYVHLSRTLRFARTAEECHVSPSTLSRSVARLEAEVGARLFDRDPRRVELTAAGQRFRRFAVEVLDAWERTAADLAGEDGLLHGTLSIYCTVTAAQGVLPALLARFREEHPEVRLDVETGDAADALDRVLSGGVHAAVAALPSRPPAGLAVHELDHTPLVLVAPVAGLAAVDREPTDWPSVPFVLPLHGLVRAHADRWLRSVRVPKPFIASEVHGHEAVLSLVALGVGVGVVPRMVIEKSALRSQVRLIRVDPPLPSLRLGVCAQRSQLADPLVGALWRSLRSD